MLKLEKKLLPYEITQNSLTYFWAVILGLVQGITEFLPVSSSGHLALAQYLGMGQTINVLFDVLLHIATLIVVIVFFSKEIVKYIRYDRKVLTYIIIATIPTAIIGLTFKNYFEALRNSPSLICIGLIITAIFLIAAEYIKKINCKINQLGKFPALAVGICQALAIAPGISRSGLTISGTMLCGVNKNDAFSFSFLLSIPAVSGAAIVKIMEIFTSQNFENIRQTLPVGPCIIGFITAGVSGYFALAMLKKIILKNHLVWFAGYCLVIAIMGLVYFNFIA